MTIIKAKKVKLKLYPSVNIKGFVLYGGELRIELFGVARLFGCDDFWTDGLLQVVY